MAEITLLASQQAREGFEFTYGGAAPVCRTCPYRHACLTLDVGRRYAVTRVRPVQHPCALQEVSANVVEVKAVAQTVVVEAPSAIVGSTIELGRFACRRLDCSNWERCAGPTLPSKQKLAIQSVEPSLTECRIGRSLKRARAV